MALLGHVLLLFIHSQSFIEPDTIVSHFCPYPSSPLRDNLTKISPSFTFGFVALVWGSSIRLWCFRTLGSLFTYEISIQANHELVVSGPYSVVRHPSYTGIVVMLAGAAVTCLSPGGYIRECNLMDTNVKFFIELWLISFVFVTISIWRRGEVEDLALEKNFGQVWRRYSETVAYRFIPYLM